MLIELFLPVLVAQHTFGSYCCCAFVGRWSLMKPVGARWLWASVGLPCTFAVPVEGWVTAPSRPPSGEPWIWCPASALVRWSWLVLWSRYTLLSVSDPSWLMFAHTLGEGSNTPPEVSPGLQSANRSSGGFGSVGRPPVFCSWSLVEAP